MAMHTDLPIHKVAFDLLSLATDVTRNTPRDFTAIVLTSTPSSDRY